MTVVLRREFIVSVTPRQAWEHLEKVEQWPTWARHIKRIELHPPGSLRAHSYGVIHLRNGVRSTFKMVEFNPHRNWRWVGPFLWMTVDYDHQFEAVDESSTRLTWTVAVDGIAAQTLGRVFTLIYRRNL